MQGSEPRTLGGPCAPRIRCSLSYFPTPNLSTITPLHFRTAMPILLPVKFRHIDKEEFKELDYKVMGHAYQSSAILADYAWKASMNVIWPLA